MRSFLNVRLGREIALVQSTSAAGWEPLIRQVEERKLTRKERLAREAADLKTFIDVVRAAGQFP